MDLTKLQDPPSKCPVLFCSFESQVPGGWPNEPKTGATNLGQVKVKQLLPYSTCADSRNFGIILGCKLNNFQDQNLVVFCSRLMDEPKFVLKEERYLCLHGFSLQSSTLTWTLNRAAPVEILLLYCQKIAAWKKKRTTSFVSSNWSKKIQYHRHVPLDKISVLQGTIPKARQRRPVCHWQTPESLLCVPHGGKV